VLRLLTTQIAELISHLENGTVDVHKDIIMSLYENINKRKKAGTSRSKANSTISDKNYANMKKGFPNSKKNKRKAKLKKIYKG
tara:strand:+ start:99 stop:347 length:249 start_codon:yes stop_codon:yes gene_type:complete